MLIYYISFIIIGTFSDHTQRPLFVDRERPYLSIETTLVRAGVDTRPHSRYTSEQTTAPHRAGKFLVIGHI